MHLKLTLLVFTLSTLTFSQSENATSALQALQSMPQCGVSLFFPHRLEIDHKIASTAGWTISVALQHFLTVIYLAADHLRAEHHTSIKLFNDQYHMHLH